MFRFGMGELAIIFLIILLLFGASRLPAIARALGKSIKEFKKGAKGLNEDIQEPTTKEGEEDKSSKA